MELKSLNPDDDEHHKQISLNIDELDKTPDQQMFFFNDQIFAVEMEKQERRRSCPTTKKFQFFRVSDCSKLCVLDMTDFTVIVNTSNMRCRNKQTAGLLDRRTNKLYQTEIVTLLHLGATYAKMFDKDVKKKLVNSMKND